MVGFTEKTRTGEVETGGQSSQRCTQARRRVCGTPPLAAMRFILSRAASRGHGRCLGLWDVSVAFFHATIEEEVFVRPPKNVRKDKTIWRLLKAMCGTQVAHMRTVCGIQ